MTGTTTATTKLVWVAGGHKNENQQGAHLLQTQGDACQIKWLTSGTTQWIAKNKVTEQLPRRARRRPGKFSLLDDDSEEEDNEPIMMDTNNNECNKDDNDTAKSHGSSIRTAAKKPSVSIQGHSGARNKTSALGLKNVAQRPSLGVPKTPRREDVDDDTASMSSSSLSSLTQEETDHNVCSRTTAPNTSTVERSETVPATVSSSQSSATNEQTSPIASAQLPTDSHCTYSNDASLFSARYAVQTIGGVVSRRIKSMFTWKRRPRSSLSGGGGSGGDSNNNTSKTTSGTKRPRMVDAGSCLSGIVVDVSNDYSPDIHVRKMHRTTTHGSARKTRIDTPARPTPSPPTSTAENNIMIEEVIRRIALEPIHLVREGITSRKAAGKSLNTCITLRDSDGSEQTTTPLLSWARDRYDKGTLEWGKPFLSDDATAKGDASETLKLLLQHGANPYLGANGTSPLSAAVAGRNVVAVAALLDQVDYTVDHLNLLDENGDTVLHSALRKGHYSCFKLVLDKFSAKVILEQVLDAHGENVLFTLVRCTDVPYDQDVTASPRDSKTLAVLKKLLRVVNEQRLDKPLMHKNKHGETVLAVAAMAGCLHEAKELAKIEFGCGRSVSNRCREENGRIQSPLDLAKETLRLVNNAATNVSWSRLQRQFQERRIGGIGYCNGNRYRIGNWVERGLGPVIEFLEEIQEPLALKSLQKLPRYNRRVSKVTGEQVLTKLAQDLQDKYAPAASRNVQPPSIRCELQDWKCINGSRSLLRGQILDMVRKPCTIPQVTVGLIRDPKDPCIRSSNSTDAKHYGLFANEDIPKHTVVCEYSGLVRREDEGEYDANPEYGVKLTQCDEWAYLEGGNYADAFILDAANVFNEASLINDVRHNVLEDEDDSEHDEIRTENVAYVEVLVNKWPRVFIITTTDIKAGSELLIDYGASYWEKLSVSIMKEKLETEKDRVEELEAENALLRDKLKQQRG